MRFYKGSLCRDARASPKSQINNGGRPVDLVRLHHNLHHSFWCFGVVGQNNSLKTSDIISDKLNKTENAFMSASMPMLQKNNEISAAAAIAATGKSAQRFGINIDTVKRILRNLTDNGHLVKHGNGRTTFYTKV